VTKRDSPWFKSRWTLLPSRNFFDEGGQSRQRGTDGDDGGGREVTKEEYEQIKLKQSELVEELEGIFKRNPEV